MPSPCSGQRFSKIPRVPQHFFALPARGRGAQKSGTWGPESGPLRPEKTWISIGRVSKMVPRPWAEVGDHCHHPQGVQAQEVLKGKL